jgi:hypothetical protein
MVTEETKIILAFMFGDETYEQTIAALVQYCGYSIEDAHTTLIEVIGAEE